MTGEEMERAIDFLLKSQANLEARIEQVNTNLGARIDETNRQLAETNKQLGDYANMQTTLIQVVTRTFEAQAAINKRTDERLNALIVTVEKLINERGGKP
jgi:DNA-binding transcriptional regulator GbsR (MarR family)